MELSNVESICLANVEMQDVGLAPVFTDEAKITDHKQYGGEFEGETLRKVFQPGKLPYMAMILLGETPRVVVLKRGAEDLI